jgi:hypothetical protein
MRRQPEIKEGIVPCPDSVPRLMLANCFRIKLGFLEGDIIIIN